jgi:hypothetical protein
MDINGIWKAAFSSGNEAFGEGHARLEDGRVYGGDENYLYLGRYVQVGDTMTAIVDVINYTGAFIAVVGDIDRFMLHLTGVIVDGQIRLMGPIQGNENRKIVINLTRERLLMGRATG